MKPSRSEIKEKLIKLIKSKPFQRISTEDVYDELAEIMEISADLRKENKRGSESWWNNEVRWARSELVNERRFKKPEESGRGIWELNNDFNLFVNSSYNNEPEKSHVSQEIMEEQITDVDEKLIENCDTIDNEIKYWIFQGSPKIYKVVESLKDKALKTWSVKAHKEKIKKGDKVILWVTGNESGCYALCSVTSNITSSFDDESELKYYTEQSKNEIHDQVKISIDFNLADNPILIDELLKYSEFNDFKGGNQGTNFIASQEQYDKIKYLHLLKSCYLDESDFKKYLKILLLKKQLIFQGAPGTGKSFLAEIFTKYITDNQLSQYEIIQFHPSYSYEDFVQGYRPIDFGKFIIKDGVFVEICNKARQKPQHKFVIFVDEINRGNISKIFGELLFLLEYREKNARLTYTPDKYFSIPSNLYIIGTMNTADRSLAMVDYALRRRFAFITLKTDYNIISKILNEQNCNLDINKLTGNVQNINKAIEKNLSLGKGFEIGHSYFIKQNDLDLEKLEYLWDYEICPLLEEYYFDDISEVEKFKNLLFSELK